MPIISVRKFAPSERISGPVAEHGELRARLLGGVEVRQVGQPDHDRAEDGADHLGGDVGPHLRPLELPDGGEPDRHRGVEMRARDPSDAVDRERDRESPAGGDDDPAALVPLGAAQDDVGDHAVAEDDQDHRADELRHERLHRDLLRPNTTTPPPVTGNGVEPPRRQSIERERRAT